MKLYNLNEEIAVLEHHMQEAETEGTEAPEVWKKHLDELLLDRALKIESCGILIKNWLAMAEALKSEETTLKRRREVLENRATWLTNYLKFCLQPGEKYQSPKVQLRWHKSDSVEIINEYEIPDEYITITQETSIDKIALKKKLRAGEEVAGVRLQVTNNLIIK